jgi:hypothetical protein
MISVKTCNVFCKILLSNKLDLSQVTCSIRLAVFEMSVIYYCKLFKTLAMCGHATKPISSSLTLQLNKLKWLSLAGTFGLV